MMSLGNVFVSALWETHIDPRSKDEEHYDPCKGLVATRILE